MRNKYWKKGLWIGVLIGFLIPTTLFLIGIVLASADLTSFGIGLFIFFFTALPSLILIKIRILPPMGGTVPDFVYFIVSVGLYIITFALIGSLIGSHLRKKKEKIK